VSKSTPHKYNMLYLCGVDFDTLYNKEFNPNSEYLFTIFQGSFINTILDVNIVLPVPVYTEYVNSYLNLEGCYRRTSQAIIPFFGILSDMQIFQTLHILRKIYKISFLYIKNLKLFVNFFSKLINYKCAYFFNLEKKFTNNFKFSKSKINNLSNISCFIKLFQSLC